MIRILSAFIFFSFLTAAAFAQENVRITSGSGEKKTKILILPFENKTEAGKFPGMEQTRSIIFRSMYTFINIIPNVDVPSEESLYKVAAAPKTMTNSQFWKDADFVIYGSYLYSGNKSNPGVQADLKIWSRQSQNNIVQASYKTTAGVELLDSVDEMISNVLLSAFDISANVGSVRFANFKIGREKYRLMVNDKLVAMVTNSNFTLTLKMLPDVKYEVRLLRDRDVREVLAADVVLKAYQSIKIEYTGYGAFYEDSLNFRDRNKTYTFELDGKPVAEKSVVSNLEAGLNYTALVKDGSGNQISSNTFYLVDGVTITNSPSDNNPGMFHAKLFSLDRNMATIGADIFIGRYFWFGLGTGGSFFAPASGSSMKDPIIFVSPYAEVGYYLFGDMSYPFRAGLGLEFRDNIFLPADVVEKAGIKAQNFDWNAGAFAQIEYMFFMVKPTFYFYMDNGNPAFSYGIGAGFKL